MHRFLTAMAIAAVTVASSSQAQTKQPAPGQGRWVSAGELALLPQFCWWQFTDKRGPEFEMRGCGPTMGHYCWGLAEQLRARRTYDNPQHKIAYLKITKKHSVTALNSINTSYPACPHREHIENTLRTVEPQLRALGVK